MKTMIAFVALVSVFGAAVGQMTVEAVANAAETRDERIQEAATR